MKILLVGVNSRFTHTNLALRYMRESLVNEKYKVILKEYTINNEFDYILGDMKYNDYYYICFSTYIWNINVVEKICEVIKKSNEEIKIIFGGPEVTYNNKEYLAEYPYVDYIIKGEGEKVLPNLVDSLEKNLSLQKISGIMYRDKKRIIDTPGINKINNLEELPFPYQTEFKSILKKKFFNNKYLYYETTRGCPYSCGFCLSSTDNGIRKLSFQRIKVDLDKIYQLDPLIIKFVDRTFNFDWRRSREIIKYIVSKKKKIKVHYEITADIINEEFLDFLKRVPKNIFQFEIGLQSINKTTLKEIRRKMDLDNIRLVLKELSKSKNIHLHLDLIAGLPKENYFSFIKSFNEAYNLNADKVQLGFLKVLKGTSVFKRREGNGLVYRSFPPYEIIKTSDIKAEEIQELKKIDNILSKYYSEGYFTNVVEYLIDKYYKNPFSLYKDITIYWDNNNYFKNYHKRRKLYDILYKFSKEREHVNEKYIDEFIKDFVANNKNYELPQYIDKNKEEIYKKYKTRILQSSFFVEKYFKKIYKKYNGKIINEFRIVEIYNKANLFVYEEECKIYEIEKEFTKLRKEG